MLLGVLALPCFSSLFSYSYFLVCENPGTRNPCFFPPYLPQASWGQRGQEVPKKENWDSGEETSRAPGPRGCLCKLGLQRRPQPAPGGSVEVPTAPRLSREEPGVPRDRRRGRGVSQELSCGSAGGGGTDQGPAPQEAPRRRRPRGVGPRAGPGGAKDRTAGSRATLPPATRASQSRSQTLRGAAAPGGAWGSGAQGRGSPGTTGKGSGSGRRSPLCSLGARGGRGSEAWSARAAASAREAGPGGSPGAQALVLHRPRRGRPARPSAQPSRGLRRPPLPAAPHRDSLPRRTHHVPGRFLRYRRR